MPAIIEIGTVVRATPGTYDYIVSVPGRARIVARALDEVLGRPFGVSGFSMLLENTPVLVWIPSDDSTYGCIIGAIPSVTQGKPTVAQIQTSPLLAYLLSPESGASLWSEPAYSQPQGDSQNRDKLIANNQRPADTLPGDWGKANVHGVTVAILGLLATMKASNRAKIEFHVLDDLVRLVSGQYQHFSSLGETHIYNDGGLVSFEFAGSPHDLEVRGLDELAKDGMFEADDRDKKYLSTDFKERNPGQTVKRRMQAFLGALGDVFQLYLGKPEAGIETYAREAVIQGLFHLHLDGSGRLGINAANGISLRRVDRIPVPKKLKEPWDPSGAKPEADDFELEPKKPFEYSTEYPFARNLQLHDGGEWLLAQAYRPFDRIEPDWHTPQRADLPVPADEYDLLNKAHENFSKYDGREAGCFVEPDGSVVIRDAWGSEIYMRGGNIIITCPGDVMTAPGKNLVQLGGRDVVIKARNSVDMSATEHDVRIKAHQNLHAYSKGGVLIESDSPRSGHGFAAGSEGEDVHSGGIVLKAANSRVFIWGKIVHLAAKTQLILEAVVGGLGSIIMAARNLLGFGRRVALVGEDGNSSLELGRSAALTGRSAVLQGSSSAGVYRGDRAMVPLQWAEIDSAPAQRRIDANVPQYISYADGDAWLDSYSEAGREPIKFTFRNQTQYDTGKATETDPEAGDFCVYEAPWQFMKKAGHALIGGSTEEWAEEEINETYPWPGKENYAGNVYVTLEQETNYDEQGAPKPRTGLSNEPGLLQKRSLNEYLAMR